MKLEVCSYSGFKVYPGHGRRFIRSDGRGFYFLNKKSEHLHFLKINPRKIDWTVLYRRKNRKGQVEETVKKRIKRATRVVRDIDGASLADIMAKRNQKPEVRKAMREQAIRATKEKQKVKESEKKQKKIDAKKKSSAPSKNKAAQKVVSKPTPRVGGKR